MTSVWGTRVTMPPVSQRRPAAKRQKTEKPLVLPVPAGVPKVKPGRMRPLIPETNIGAPPSLHTEIAINGKRIITRPKTVQPEGDHPSQEEAISSQEYEEHYASPPKEEYVDDEASEGEESEEDDSDQDSEEDESSSDESDRSDDADPIERLTFPSSIGVVGKKFAGKSNLFDGILTSRGPEFDNIFLVTLTGHTGNLNHHATSEKHVLTQVSEEFLKKLRLYQNKNNGKTLLVFDDIIGMDFNWNASKEFDKLVTTGRNSNISMLIGVQTYRKMPPVLRDNFEFAFIGNNNERNIDAIAEEMGNASMDRKMMRQCLSDVARNNRRDSKSFLFIDDEDQHFQVWKPPLTMNQSGKKRKHEDSEEDNGDAFADE